MRRIVVAVAPFDGIETPPNKVVGETRNVSPFDVHDASPRNSAIVEYNTTTVLFITMSSSPREIISRTTNCLN